MMKEQKEWFVVYKTGRFCPINGDIVTEVIKDFIYGRSTAQDAWNEHKCDFDELVSIVRV